MNKNAKIFVAGHRGMVGSALVRRLQAGGYTQVLTASRQELDLLDQRAVHDWLQENKPDYLSLPRPRSAASRPTTSTAPSSSIRT